MTKPHPKAPTPEWAKAAINDTFLLLDAVQHRLIGFATKSVGRPLTSDERMALVIQSVSVAQVTAQLIVAGELSGSEDEGESYDGDGDGDTDEVDDADAEQDALMPPAQNARPTFSLVKGDEDPTAPPTRGA